MTATVAASTELVRVRIGAIYYVLPVDAVAAVLDLSTVERAVNHEPSLWIGAIRSRVSTIRVADGGRIFGRPGDTDARTKVIVLRTASPVGFTVDEVLGSRIAAAEDILPIPETAGAAQQLLVSAAVWTNGGVDLAIDHAGLIEALHSNRVLQQATDVPEIPANLNVSSREALEIEIAGSGDRWWLPITLVRHIAAYREPQPLARAAPGVLGLLAWQRRPVPLISVASRLGLSSVESPSGQVIVIGEPSPAGSATLPALAALLVQRVVGLQTIANNDGGAPRRLDVAAVLARGYRADSLATELVNEPMSSISTVT